MSLFSWDYESEHPADDWFWTAQAYADSSVALFEALESGKVPRTFHHAKVAAAALEHGLELFLKGGLVLAGEKPARTHRLEGILERFSKLYPGDEYSFTARVSEAAASHLTQPPGQFLRYPVDTNGAPWLGNTHFNLELWLEQARLLRDDYARLRPRLKPRAA